MSITEKNIYTICCEDTTYFNNKLLNEKNDKYYHEGNLIELYSKIKHCGYKKGIFLSNNPFDTLSYTDELYRKAKEIWPNLDSYNYHYNEPKHLGFIFNISFHIPKKHLSTFCKIIAEAINSA